MNQKVIQFGQLEELLTEPYVPGQVMRVVILETSESLARQIPGWRLVHIGVHVRTIDKSGHILACHLPVAEPPRGAADRATCGLRQRYDAAWEEAAELKERVVTFLQTAAENKGFIVRTGGVIDLGEIRPLRATWKTDPALLTKNLVDEHAQ